MKKNRVNKLTLNKETLRSLDESRMPEVAGGATQGGCYTKTPDCYTQYTYCGSCGIACTAIDCTP
jgi:hypothetical protein